MLNTSQKKVKRKELWRGFYFYTCMCSLLMRSAALDSWYSSQLLNCVAVLDVAGDPICPLLRPGLSRLMTHSSPSGGRVSGHDEPVCHFHQSPRERYLARHQHQPQHQIYTLYTILRQVRIIKLKQKIWWTYLNVEKTKEALLVCVSGPVFLSRRKITKPLLT